MPETRHSVCALDCPDCCSLSVTVEDGCGVKLRGDASHPITRGFLCGKVAQYLEREYSPDRLLYPLRRIGAKGEGRFERISWDEALDAIVMRLKSVAAAHGSEAILPYSYSGTMGLLNNAGMDRRFFHRLGASRLDRTICATAGMAGMTDALGLRFAMETERFRRREDRHRVGRERTGDERSPVAVHCRSAEAGREVLRNRPESQPDREDGGQTFRHQPRQRYRAGSGDDACHHQRESLRRRLCRALHRGLRRAARTRSGMDAATRLGTDGPSERGDRRAGARICDHAARRHPAELWRAAQRPWRHGRAGDSVAARAHRERGKTWAAACNFPPLILFT